jgi:hypothetical protein
LSLVCTFCRSVLSLVCTFCRSVLSLAVFNGKLKRSL